MMTMLVVVTVVVEERLPIRHRRNKMEVGHLTHLI